MKVKHTKKTPPSKRLTKKQLKSMVGGAQAPGVNTINEASPAKIVTDNDDTVGGTNR